MSRLFVLLLPLALVGCGERAGGPVRIRVSLILGEASEWYKGAARWKELVEKRTAGRDPPRRTPGARVPEPQGRRAVEAPPGHPGDGCHGGLFRRRVRHLVEALLGPVPGPQLLPRPVAT